MLKRIAQVLAAFACVATFNPASAAPYTITLMDYAPGVNSAGWDVNNAGVFVGTAVINDVNVSYIVNAGVTTTLSGPEGAISTSALGISDSGEVVGSYYKTADGLNIGYIYSAGVYTSFSLPGATTTELRGISPNGRYITGVAVLENGSSMSFVYDRVSLSLIPILHTVSRTTAQGVNNEGVVVGDYRTDVLLPRHSFVFDSKTGTLTDFASPSQSLSFRGINDSGEIDGFFADASGTHGFVGFVDSPFDIAGASLTGLEGNNDAGWLVGFYADDTGLEHAFLATKTVDEPATLSLICFAMGGLGASARRKSKRS
jgi:uncharacterized membrane protein